MGTNERITRREGPTPMTRRVWLECLAGCAILVMKAGCSSDPVPNPAPAPPLPSGAAVRGAEQGLEVVWWPVDDSTGGLSRALAAYASRPTPLDATKALTLRANGLRVVAVPIQDVDKLRVQLRLAGPVQRRWLGQIPQWTPVIGGPSWSDERTIELDQPERAVQADPESLNAPPEGLLRLGPGRLRLLARCWIEPDFKTDRQDAGLPRVSDNDGDEEALEVFPQTASVGAALHIELVPQHESGSKGLDGILPAGGPGAEAEGGLVFSRLTFGASCDGSDVLLLVPETPVARWRSPDEVSTDSPGTPPLPPPIRGIERPPTLGEAMLSDAQLGGFARTKIVVLLVPRVPDDYSLFGP